MAHEFCIIRLGKSSVEEINAIDSYNGNLKSNLTINVACKQVPTEVNKGMYCFIWLGSDNNKGVPTKWQQGLRALGTIESKSGGPGYLDEWYLQISIGYVFNFSISKHSFVEYASSLYHKISDIPVIGLSNSSNQTVQIIKLDHPTQDITSLFQSIELIQPTFIYNISKVYPALDEIGINDPVTNINNVTNQSFTISDFIESYEDEIEFEESQPFDPEKISIDTKGITMETCLRRLEQNTIILAPDFQRNEVWTIEKRCRLIESLMLKIPLPMFYVSSDEKGIFSVVDGLQRLSTIRSFILGDIYLKSKKPDLRGEGFSLQNLEFWGDKYDGSNFNELPIYLQNRILETEFTFTIINPGTPEEVKRNVFKRINTGGEPLTSQEIRHALYTGKSTELLKELSKENSFLSATGLTVKSDRMADRELVLRFLAFTIRNYTEYPKNNDMDSFLSDTMRIVNVLPDVSSKEALRLFKNIDITKIFLLDVSELKNLFIKSMIRAQILFGVHAFRKSYSYERKAPINKALFEVWSVLLSRLTEVDFNKLISKKEYFLDRYIQYLQDDSFNYVISKNSLKFSSVKERYENLSLLLDSTINAE